MDKSYADLYHRILLFSNKGFFFFGFLNVGNSRARYRSQIIYTTVEQRVIDIYMQSCQEDI